MGFARWLFTRAAVQRRLRPILERAIAKPTYWRGGTAEEPTFLSRELFTFRGWTFELHGFTSVDFEGEFHSHPYDAYRFVLSGGYVEEVVPEACAYIVRADGIKEITCATERAAFFEGNHGEVKWSHRHRIDQLYRPALAPPEEEHPMVFTLWAHGPRTHETELFAVANLKQPPPTTP